VGVVTADLEDGGVGEPVGGSAAVEESVEGFGAPGFEGVEDVIGVDSFGREGVIEEFFEIPAEFAHEVGVGLAFDHGFVGGRQGDGREGFAVGAS
jgi:hypothetical protein